MSTGWTILGKNGSVPPPSRIKRDGTHSQLNEEANSGQQYGYKESAQENSE
jgi:hypothetical protein